MILSRRWAVDQLGREVAVPFPPRRIVSVVPSQTELLYSLGLDEDVVGITRFCVHPQEWYRQKKRIGGTKQLHIDQIRALRPDLIIANKEENEKSQIETLMAEFPVWISDISTLDDALKMISSVGRIVDRADTAEIMVQDIQAAFAALQPGETKRTAYFIWRNPWMVAGGDTFIHNMLQRCGLVNIFGEQNRYPVVELSALSDCELVLLSSEPYPFKEQHIAEIRRVCPHARVLLVDGEMFSWYGSHLLASPAYFRDLLQL